ncbi:MAG TPA: alpha/beta hydrolase [Archangium sp.]
MDRSRAHAVRFSGSGEPLVIFGHGIGGHQDQWAPVVEAVAKQHRVMTFGIAGATDTDRSLFSPARHGSILGYADDLSLLCAELNVRGAIYVGHSLSAMAGALASAADPGLFSKLVLLNGSPRYVDDPSQGYVGGLSSEQVDQILGAVASDYAAWSSGFAASMMGNPDRPSLTNAFARSLLEYDPRVAAVMVRAAFSSDFRAHVAKVDAPTLVLQSTDDAAVPMQTAKWLAAHLPRAELSTLSTTGHFPHVVAPAEVIDALARFGVGRA